MSIASIWLIYNFHEVFLLKYRRIRDLREDNDLTQTQVAKILGVAQRTYSHYENDTVNISIDQISILADFYKTSVDYLINRTDEKKPYPKPKII